MRTHQGNRWGGAVEELSGKLKGAIGKVLGNERMQVEGRAKELKGKAQKDAAKTSERIHGKIEEVAGEVKQDVGAAIDSARMEAEGKAKELKGRARQAGNK